MPELRKRFSDKQRKQAVDVLLAGGDPETIAKSLGVSVSVLYSWRDAAIVVEAERRYRAVAPEYDDWIEKRGRWPKAIPAKKWISRFSGACSSTDYSKLCNQGYVLEKYAGAFVAMLVEKADDPDLYGCFRLTEQYLAQFGIEALHESNCDLALEHMFTPSILGSRPRRPLLDFCGGLFGLLGRREFGEIDERYVRGCRAKDLPAVIDWMYTRVGHCTSPRGSLLPPQEAALLGAQVIGLGQRAYIEQARKWVAKYPWTVVQAQRGGQPYGMTIVLPVTREFYELVLAGKRAPYQCTPADLSSPSTYIIIEAGAERPEMTTEKTLNELTWPIGACFAFQFGAMVRSHRFRTATALHLLSFGGTPKNKVRLAKEGFIPKDSYIPGTKVQIMEKVVQLGTSATLLKSDLFVLQAVSTLAPDEPLPCAD